MIHIYNQDNTLLCECVFRENTSIEQLVKDTLGKIPEDVYSCRIRNHNLALSDICEDGDKITLYGLSDSYASTVYQTSLCFLYIKAVHDVLGTDIPVRIANTLSSGFLTKLRKVTVSEEDIEKITARMKELVALDLPILCHKVGREELIAFLKKQGHEEQLELVLSSEEVDSAYICQLEEEEQSFYVPMVPSTGYLQSFECVHYKNAIILRYPSARKQGKIPPFEEQPLIYNAFSEATRWDRIMGVHYACDLNDRIKAGGSEDLILMSEALHEKRIAEIAQAIKIQNKRIVLIAGPSSSGKTSFAKRLCIQLRVIGLRPLYLGTDDYFFNDEDSPVLENGEKDWESIRAVDTELFASNMNDLLRGKKVDLPTFDFIQHRKVFGQRITTIDSSQPIVIEGIHGLNPKLTEGIDDNEKFKIYVSPLIQVRIDIYNRIPNSDLRCLRRIIRDHQFRDHSAENTLLRWKSVRDGEEVNIFPYTELADEYFNSCCIYEPAVTKKYAAKLLKQISDDSPAYGEAQRLLNLLKAFVPMEDDSAVPNNSLIREFIGGSVLVH
ncbi:MAG: hypothetical protein IKR06_01745 [Erysipelotrichaceae bacterium]|nr:hypothetical protein [Erysipelotrichaceae bacterium]